MVLRLSPAGGRHLVRKSPYADPVLGLLITLRGVPRVLQHNLVELKFPGVLVRAIGTVLFFGDAHRVFGLLGEGDAVRLLSMLVRTA